MSAAEGARAGAGASVLLADDHALVRAGVRRVLEGAPRYRLVGEAASGAETLARLAELAPDVLLLDLNMPDGDGFEVLRRARAASPRTRVVVLTIHAQAEYVTRAVREGAAGYLLKDLAVQDLIAALDAVTAGRPFFSAQAQGALVRTVRQQEPGPLARLTAREREVLIGIARGLTTKEIAAQYGLSARTVESHRASLMRKLAVRSVALLTQLALREGLVEPPG